MTRRRDVVSGGLPVLGAAIAGAAPGGAAAQDGSFFERDRNVSVLERVRPGAETYGVRAGQFVLSPRLDLTIGYASNVFGISGSDLPVLERYEDESAFYGVARPSIEGRSDWNRHEVSFGAYAEVFGNERFSSESLVNAGAQLGGVYQAGAGLELFGELFYDHLRESRLVNNVNFLPQEPVPYDRHGGELGIRQELGRSRWQARLDVSEYDYDDVELIVLPGVDQGPRDERGAFDQDFRDHTRVRVEVEPAYAVSPDTALFARASYNERDHEEGADLLGLDRDSQGWRAGVGAEFDLTRLIRGDVAIAYFEQDYDDPSFETASGVGVDGRIEWFPTQLTTVTLTGERDVDESAFVGAGGVISTEVILRADHELRRDTLLYAYGGYGDDQYDDFDQSIGRGLAGLGARYDLRTGLSVSVDYAYLSQDVDRDAFNGGFGTDYNVHEASLTLTLRR